MKKLSLILALILALSVLLCFSACKSDDTDATDGATEAPTDAPQAIDGVLLSGEGRYKIIYPEGTPKAAALKIYDKLLSLDPVAIKTPAYYSLTTDKVADSGAPEILVGLTNRAASAAARDALPNYPDFSITFSDNKIAIYASTEERLDEAVKFFISNMKATEDGRVYCTLKENYVDSYAGDYKEFTIDGTPVSDFTIIIPTSASETLRAFALELSNTLSTIAGKNISISEDSATATENEILLGKTNRPESVEPSAANDRLIYTGGKLVFCPSTESGYGKLLLHVVSEAIIRSGKLTSESITVNSLSNEIIKTVTFGALLFTETTEGLQVNKCTADQIAAWGTHDKTTQASASTGIRLDFLTNSSHFHFRGTSTSVFELFINGELKSQSTNGIIDVDLDTSKGENRVTVLFPNHDANVCIREVVLDEGASLTPHTYDRKFLILGDSITQGKTSSASSIAYANQISMMFNADSVIQGISGGRFFADTLDPNADFDPDYIFVAFGTNDWSWGRPDEATYTQYIKEYFAKLRTLYPDATIFGLAPIWREDNSPSSVGEFETARQIIMDEVEAIGGIAIDCIDFVPHESKYYADSNCLHPNDEGFEHYSKNLYEAVKDYIK